MDGNTALSFFLVFSFRFCLSVFLSLFLTYPTMKDSIRHRIQQALVRLTSEGVLPEGLTPAIQVENT